MNRTRVMLVAALVAAVFSGSGVAMAAGGLDIADNLLVIDKGTVDLDTNGDGIPDLIGVGQIDALRSYLIQGLGDGTWNGTTGVYSSTAGDDNNNLGFATAIGYADNSDTYYTGFDTNTFLDPEAVMVGRYTWAGDADLDGDVTTTDRANWFSSYLDKARGLSYTANWLNGDFDYDGDITTSDQAVWFANYLEFAKHTPGYVAFHFPVDYGVGPAPMAAPNGSPVPEPGTLFLMAVGAAVVFAWRKVRK